MLTGKTSKRFDVPHEPGNWFEVRRLSWAELDRARETKLAATMTTARAMGAELMEAMQAGRSLIVGAPPAPIDSYDTRLLLSLSVAGWGGPEYDGQAVDTSQLDEQTKDWALGVIANLSLPRTEAETKNS